jgi:L-alanine-DL-glutamate epimerase-like enolase superfamily enzyme
MEYPIHRIDVSRHIIPTDFPESDGTFEWDSTTIIVVEIHAGNAVGIGYTYGDAACARLVDRVFSPLILGGDALATTGCWTLMRQAVRNIGRPGIASMAISAIDSALWDLKARLFDVSLVELFGGVRDGLPIYGSGGFTSYSIQQLESQFHGWASRGLTRMKMKVGRNPAEDVERVRAARTAVGPDVELFVDANGAYSVKQAIHFSQEFDQLGVTWFEEPVSSDDLEGLRHVRQRAAAGMDIAAGEYGFEPEYFGRMLDAQSVDVLQIDATRCQGITGFLQSAILADVRHIPISAHTAPSLHVHVCCGVPGVRHVEYFHDHVRVEEMLFDGVLQPQNGMLFPDRSRPGNGLEFKRSDAARYAA